MGAKKIRLTRSGLEKLEKEYLKLTTVKRREIAKALAHAREFGDLSENAEYEAAKEAQILNEKRIAELSEKLGRAELLDEDIPKDRVFLGALVTLEDLDTEEKIQYMLVSPEEADFKENKISLESPIGKGLLGHRQGDKLTIEAPAGPLHYKIIKIER